MTVEDIDWKSIHDFMLTIERTYIDQLLSASEDDEFYYCILGAYEDDNKRTTA